MMDTFVIKARAKDEFDAVGEWGSFDVSMPRTKATFNPLFYWLWERFSILERLLGLIR